MVIVPLFKKLDTPIIISKKYGIVVSNLSKEDSEFLYEHISEELIEDQKYKSKYKEKTIDELMQSLYCKTIFLI